MVPIIMNITQHITVWLKLGLIQINLDEKSWILTLSVWAHYVCIASYFLISLWENV